MSNTHYEVIGSGMVAHTLAALWPHDISWAFKDQIIPTSSKPLLIHHSNAWLLHHLAIKRTAVTHIQLFEENIGFVHSLQASSFNLEAFGWMINPKELMESLKCLIQTRENHSNHNDAFLFVATGPAIPQHIPYTETTGLSFTSIQSPPTTPIDEHSIVLHWMNEYISATLPATTAQMTPTTITTHTSPIPSDTSSQAYQRQATEAQHLLIGDSALRIPPTLASGYNTTLKFIKHAMNTRLNWRAMKDYSHKQSNAQLSHSQHYHRMLQQKWMRPSMTASFKNPHIMRHIIQETLCGIH